MMERDERRQGRLRIRQQLFRGRRFRASTVLNHRESVRARRQPRRGLDVDRDVDRRAAGVEHTDRPDIERAAGEVDPAASRHANVAQFPTSPGERRVAAASSLASRNTVTAGGT
jgi:hypothetical protein